LEFGVFGVLEADAIDGKKLSRGVNAGQQLQDLGQAVGVAIRQHVQINGEEDRELVLGELIGPIAEEAEEGAQEQYDLLRLVG
jgi:hypothetical protein